MAENTVVSGGIDRSHNYEFYRRCMNDPAVRTQGMETEGLDEEQFDSALSNPRSAVLGASDHAARLPLAVPVEYMPYLNQAYLHKVTTADATNGFELYYYNHLAPFLHQDSTKYIEALRSVIQRIAGGLGALVTDHVHFDKLTHDRDISYIAGQLGYKVLDLLAREKPPVQHYQYASPMLASDTGRLLDQPLSLIDGYRAAVSRGLVGETDPIKAHERLDEEDIEYVWGFYGPAFEELDVIDPVLSGFNESQFREVMKDKRFVKIVHRTQGKNIANLALLASLDACPWINNSYFRQHFRSEYESDQIIVSPGIIADPASQSRLSLGTIGMVRKLVEFSGGEPVLTFICDEVSNRQVPGLSHAGLNRSNELLTDFSYPRARQLFRVFQFEGTTS